MARRIPVYDAVPAASQSVPGSGASADALGSGIARSLGELGEAGQRIGLGIAGYQRALRVERERQDGLAVASLSARMAVEWETEYQRLIQSSPPGSPGFAQRATEAYDRFMESRTAELSGNQSVLSRPIFARARAEALIRAIRHEAESATGHSRLLAERGLASTINLVALNPGAFNEAVATGSALIDNLNLPANVREELRRNHVDLLTRAAFEARIYAARTPQELDAVLAELGTQEWRDRAKVATYDQLLSTARAFRRTIISGRNAEAQAAIEHLSDRMTATGAGRVTIDAAELARVDAIVRSSQDPGVQWRWARLRARYDAGSLGVRASPDALSDAIGSTLGQLSLPADVQAGIDAASRATGVSASFLSQVAGSMNADYFRQLRENRQRFALQGVHAGVDLNTLTPQLRDAGALAGQYFGRPLRITSGARTPFRNLQLGGAERSLHTEGSAIDIDITGMDAGTRARLVESLVRAGFTGFGQYGTHIHADMRASVPSSFRPGWGGWTQLDPEIQAVLDRRGFRAGRPSTEIDRTGPPLPPVTEMPETGVFNFQGDVWRGLIARHATTLGLPYSAETTPGDIQQWLRDPRIAAQVAAIYAVENRAALEAGLGRTVSEPELGLAHYLGPAGALSLIRAYHENPSQDASVLGLRGQTGTVGDVYTRLIEGYTSGVGALQHTRLEELRRVQAELNTVRASGDIMTYGARAGRVTLAPLDSEDSFTTRGQQALEVSRFYRLESGPRPLTAAEVDRFSAVIREGTIGDVQTLLANLQRLGPEAASGAFRQLGSQNGVFAHVAGLMASDPASMAVAHDVLRGSIRLRDNPDIRQVFTTAPGGTDNQFNLVVGSALDSADPAVRQAMRAAADALYIQRYSSGQTAFDARQYREAVLAVLGSQIGRVNGAETVLPRGVSASEFDRALDNLTPLDLLGMSVDGQAPRRQGGQTVSPTDIAYEGRLRAVGADTYEVVMADGLPLQGAPGRSYRIRLAPATVRQLLGRQTRPFESLFDEQPWGGQ